MAQTSVTARRTGWRGPVAVALGAVAFSLVGEHVNHGWEQPVWLPILDLSITWLLVACGLVSMLVRPAQPAGPRLIAAGYLSCVLGFSGSEQPVVSSLGFAFGLYHDLILLWLAMSFPDRWPTSRLARFALGTTAALYLLQSAVRLVMTAPATTGFTLLEPDLAQHLTAAVDIVRAASVGGCGIVLAAMLLRASPARRRGVGLVLGAGVATAVASVTNAQYALTVFGFLPPIDDDVTVPLAWAFNAVRIVIPLAILAGVLRAQVGRTAIASAVARVGPAPTSAALRDALSTALGDPDLRILVRGPGETYRDSSGAAVPAAEVDRLSTDPAITVAPVEADGQRVAALVISTPGLDESLIEAGAAVTALVVQNQRLAAQVRDQLADVRASRARIVEATDSERRRIERDLHDGVQQRMVALALELRGAEGVDGGGPALRRGADEVLRILDEIRELARGIHPAVLTEAGLGPAIQAVADRSPVPVELALRLERGATPAENATAYYVVSESLANVAKHASQATAAWVTADDRDGRLRIVVEDDGPGGADPTGHGLRGLADRVAALDGRLIVSARAGGGTRIAAEIPLA